MSNETIPASSPVTQPAPKSASEIAEQMLGNIDWVSPNEGYCDCPGRHRHENKSGRRDCAVYLDSVPTIHCVHASCASVVVATNKKLRDAILNGKPAEVHKLTAEEKARRKQREENERLRLRAAQSLPQLLEEFTWPYAKIISDSPVAVTGNERDHWRLLLGKGYRTTMASLGAELTDLLAERQQRVTAGSRIEEVDRSIQNLIGGGIEGDVIGVLARSPRLF